MFIRPSTLFTTPSQHHMKSIFRANDLTRQVGGKSWTEGFIFGYPQSQALSTNLCSDHPPLFDVMFARQQDFLRTLFIHWALPPTFTTFSLLPRDSHWTSPIKLTSLALGVVPANSLWGSSKRFPDDQLQRIAILCVLPSTSRPNSLLERLDLTNDSTHD